MKGIWSVVIVIAAMLLTAAICITCALLVPKDDGFEGERVSTSELESLYAAYESEKADELANKHLWVYWTEGGSVWHSDPDCSYISDAAEVFHGSVEKAIESGKSRACKRCAKE